VDWAGNVTADCGVVVREVGPEALPGWAGVPIRFEVKSVYRVEKVGDGWKLTEKQVDKPWIKDYEAEGDESAEWQRRFDLSNWAFFQAFDGDRPVGGAAVAFRTPTVEMLENRDDLAVLWDLRVHPDCRGKGVGKSLFHAAVEWARSHGCRQLKIETQNINVSACKFYAAQGCRVGGVGSYPPPYDKEIMLLWYLDLR